MQKLLKKYFPVFVLPTLIAFAIAFVIPFVMGVGLSFAKFTVITKLNWVGFDNYIKIFTIDKNFLLTFRQNSSTMKLSF